MRQFLRMQVVGEVSVGRRHVEHAVLLGDVAQVVGCLQDGLPRLPVDVEAHQDARVLSVAYLIDGIAKGFHHRRAAVGLRISIAVGLSGIHFLARFEVGHLRQSRAVEEHQVSLAAELHVLQVLATLHGVGLLRLDVVEASGRQQPRDVRLVHEEVSHLVLAAELLQHVLHRIHEALGGQVHARHAVGVLQPQVVETVEIEVVVASVVRQVVGVLPAGVDIGEVVAVEEVDLSHRSDDQSSGLRAVDGLRTVVGQSVGGVIDVEAWLVSLHLQPCRQCNEQQHQPCQ